MSDKPLFTFVVLADVQYADRDDDEHRRYRQGLKRLQSIVKQSGPLRPDFVLQLGDIIDRERESFAPVLKALNGFDCPVYNVIGNHEFIPDISRQEVLSILGLSSGYYSVNLPATRLIVLDGGELSQFAYPEHSNEYQQTQQMLDIMEAEGQINAHYWNGALSDVQLNWLQQQLQQAYGSNQRVIMACHFPVYPVERHNLLNYHQVLELIDKYPCVDLFLAGHRHSGGQGCRNGANFLTLQALVDEKSPFYYIVQRYKEGYKLNKCMIDM